jgi:hypothetical protein
MWEINALAGMAGAKTIRATKTPTNGLVSGFSFQFGQLGAFLGALATSISATGECLDLGMLGAGFRQFLASPRTNIADRVGVLRAALEQLTGQGRNPRHITRNHYHLRDRVHIRLGKPSRDQPFTPASGYITSFNAIAEFRRPHKLFLG